MSDDISNLILEHLKALRPELASVKADTGDIRMRLAGVDNAVLDSKRGDVHQYEESARQQVSLDRLSERISRIEKRLELS